VIAPDTNVIVRLFTGDDPAQAAAARRALRRQDLFFSKTVLLEIEWVLRFSYGAGRPEIAQALEKLIRYSRSRIEDLPTVIEAVSWYVRGMDLADALHLVSSKPAEQLVTFDGGLAASARSLGCVPAVEVLRTS